MIYKIPSSTPNKFFDLLSVVNRTLNDVTVRRSVLKFLFFTYKNIGDGDGHFDKEIRLDLVFGFHPKNFPYRRTQRSLLAIPTPIRQFF